MGRSYGASWRADGGEIWHGIFFFFLDCVFEGVPKDLFDFVNMKMNWHFWMFSRKLRIN